MAKTHPTFEDVAELLEQVQEGVAGTQEIVREVESSLKGEIKDLREDLSDQMRESEQRLLNAIRTNEIPKHDYEALQSEVRDLKDRVIKLEKRK